MGRTIRNLTPWPVGTPLPAAGLFILYDPGTDDEYRVLPEQVGEGAVLLANELSAARQAYATLTPRAALLKLLNEGVAAAPVVVTALAAPANLRQTASTASSATLAWDAVANATSYRLRRNGSVSLLPGSATSYTDSGLAAGASLSYDVQALYAGSGPYSNSAFSAAVPASTQAAPTPAPTPAPVTPTAPTDLAVSAQRVASFTPAAGKVATDYEWAFVPDGSATDATTNDANGYSASAGWNTYGDSYPDSY